MSNFYEKAMEKANEALHEKSGGDNESFTLIDKGKKYLVVPMRVLSDGTYLRVIGCFILHAPNPSDIFITLMDDLSDAVGRKLDILEKKHRSLILNEFGVEASKLSSSGINENEIIRLIRKHIGKVMYSGNLYIALHSELKNEISFPFILKDGKLWKQKPRFINTDKQARTEWIINNEESILIYTNQEAKDWYNRKKHPDRAELADNHLASWLGVPIFLESKVIAVIAVYHPTKEYVYSEIDRSYLTSIGNHISSLFRVLKESEKEQEKRIELEEEEELIKKYLSEKIKSSFDDIIFDLDITLGILKRKTRKLISISAYESKNIDEIYKVAETYINKMKKLSPFEPEKNKVINLSELLEGVIKEQEKNTKLLTFRKSLSSQEKVKISGNKDDFYIVFTSLFSRLRDLLDNYWITNSDDCGDAICSYDLNEDDDRIILFISILNVGFSLIDLEHALLVTNEMSLRRLNVGLSYKRDDGLNAKLLFSKKYKKTIYIFIYSGFSPTGDQMKNLIENVEVYEVVIVQKQSITEMGVKPYRYPHL